MSLWPLEVAFGLLPNWCSLEVTCLKHSSSQKSDRNGTDKNAVSKTQACRTLTGPRAMTLHMHPSTYNVLARCRIHEVVRLPPASTASCTPGVWCPQPYRTLAAECPLLALVLKSAWLISWLVRVCLLIGERGCNDELHKAAAAHPSESSSWPNHNAQWGCVSAFYY